ncbi:hypothetical protein [Rhodanobacter sp. KK11]|uniref:hypothetical protein n=1 Tax=Rhodanobacter sp. KK11 TaxID=3083255 RepID=UPI002966D76F|nr:hypothetical protein [Rhodanobacter sp. KK11]MDW2979983.1 hypothetical protein [Rhodanobacter sp. KK11]
MSRSIHACHHTTDAARHLLPRSGTKFLFSHSVFTRLRRISSHVQRQLRLSRQQVSGFWRSAIRSSWIPPVPETAGRQIYPHEAPRLQTAAGLRICGTCRFFHGTKDDGTPKGAVLLPFPVRDRTPVRPISARVVAQRLPVKVLDFSQQETCQSSRTARRTLTALP